MSINPEILQVLTECNSPLPAPELTPQKMRKLVQKYPELRQMFINTPPAKQMMENSKEFIQIIYHLFRKYLTPVKENAVVLCLGSGTGHELNAARKLVPKGRVIGIDNSTDTNQVSYSVIHEMFASAEFLPWNIEMYSPEDVMRQIGAKPNIVICRHPNLVELPKWPEILTAWAKQGMKNDGRLLVTNFTTTIRETITQTLQQSGIEPIYDEYYFGIPWVSRTTGEPCVSDRYITVVKS